MAKTAKDVIETFAASVDAQINGNKEHGWGQDDSTAVIMDLVAEFSGEIAAKNNDVLQQCQKAIERVVNPSACRQWLESDKVAKLNKATSKKRQQNEWFAPFLETKS